MSTETQPARAGIEPSSVDDRDEVDAVIDESWGEERSSEISAAWSAEIDRRLEALRKGEMRVVSSEAVDRELAEILARARHRALG